MFCRLYTTIYTCGISSNNFHSLLMHVKISVYMLERYWEFFISKYLKFIVEYSRKDVYRFIFHAGWFDMSLKRKISDWFHAIVVTRVRTWWSIPFWSVASDWFVHIECDDRVKSSGSALCFFSCSLTGYSLTIWYLNGCSMCLLVFDSFFRNDFFPENWTLISYRKFFWFVSKKMSIIIPCQM